MRLKEQLEKTFADAYYAKHSKKIEVIKNLLLDAADEGKRNIVLSVEAYGITQELSAFFISQGVSVIEFTTTNPLTNQIEQRADFSFAACCWRFPYEEN